MTYFRNTPSIILIITLLSACFSKPELDKKTRLLNTLQAMETAIEIKSLDDFFDHLSDDFKSTQRGWNKKDAERLLRIRLMRNKNVHVHQVIKRMDWANHDKGEGAEQVEVEVVVAVAGSDFSLTDLSSLRGDMVKFIVTFQLVDGQYLVTQTEWKRASPTDFVL